MDLECKIKELAREFLFLGLDKDKISHLHKFVCNNWPVEIRKGKRMAIAKHFKNVVNREYNSAQNRRRQLQAMSEAAAGGSEADRQEFLPENEESVVKDINMNNRDSTCRVCLLSDPSIEMVSLRDKETWDKFQRLTQVKVLLTDTFPRQLCKDCNRILELCQSFIGKAQAADQVFRDEEALRESAMNEMEEDPWQFLYVDDDASDSLFNVSQEDDQDKVDDSIPEDEEEPNGNVPVPTPARQFHCRTCNQEFNPLKSWNNDLENYSQAINCPDCSMNLIRRVKYRYNRYRHAINGALVHHQPGGIDKPGNISETANQANRSLCNKEPLGEPSQITTESLPDEDEDQADKENRTLSQYAGHRNKRIRCRFFQCRHCFVTFSTRKQRSAHKRSAHRHKTFQCQECPRTFRRKFELRIHSMRKHEEGKRVRREKYEAMCDVRVVVEPIERLLVPLTN